MTRTLLGGKFVARDKRGRNVVEVQDPTTKDWPVTKPGNWCYSCPAPATTTWQVQGLAMLGVEVCAAPECNWWAARLARAGHPHLVALPQAL